MIELLVTISIIAILSLIGLTAFSELQKSARDTKRRSDLKAIANALEIYKVRSTDSKYPTTAAWVYSTDNNNPWIPVLNSNYMTRLPVDPTNSGGNPFDGSAGAFKYSYYSSAESGTAGSYFVLTARMESPNADDAKTSCTSNTGTTWSNDGAGGSSRLEDNFLVCNQQ